MTSESQIQIELNPPQREAVEYGDGPLLVLAGAGSGKTRVLIARAAHLIHTGRARPHQILTLTFTNKAAGELKSRAVAMIGTEGMALVAGTFHSIFARIMRMEGLNIGVDPHFTIVDADDRQKLIRSIIKENGIPIGTVRPKEIDWIISRSKNSLLTPDDLSREARHPNELVAAQVYHIYEQRLRRIKGLDFDDLLVRPLRAFEEFPGFLERLQKRFHYVLVDEFQDTNRAQYMLVHEIARSRRNICVVGDDDQAIYGFRGATVRNILDFEQDWKDVKVIRLEQNYRSRKPILDVAWSVIHNNTKRRTKKLWTDIKGGSPVELIETDSEDDEALRVVGFIAEDHVRAGRSYDEIAVLYRTNAQSLAFEHAFRTAQIPYRILGGFRFYERKEIKDVLAYMKLIVNPDDDISLMRVINYPPRSIGNSFVSQMLERARDKGTSLNQILQEFSADPDLPSRRKKALEKFIDLIEKLRKLVTEISFPDLVNEIIASTDLEQRFMDEEKDDPSRAESKLSNLTNLHRDAARYIEINPEGNVESFIEEVALVTESNEENDDVQRVNLLTLHSAKGLEFETVFIVGLEDGLLPLEPRSDTDRNLEIEEERRLFYVGATRAKTKLVLSFATDRFRWGRGGSGAPSQFLYEIPHELLKVHSKRGRWRKGYFSHPSETPRQRTGQQSRSIVRTTHSISGTLSSIDPDELRNGLLVKHPKFGLGVVVNFRRNGLNSRINIDFDDVGLKTVVLKYARLEIHR
ncbi:UvrD-helicase domain-containing protein [bacterium]|nr:UvrD-helicase domain-containing protein [bacterium]